MPRLPSLLCGSIFLAMLAPTVAAPLIPAPPVTTPLLLRGGTVHPVASLPVAGADVLIMQGRIAAVGARLTAPPDARVIDVTGRHVYPGLVAANTSLGVQEIQSIAGTRDVTETGRINPNARAQVAVNPDNSHVGVTRYNGVLTALVTPQSREPYGPVTALIAGQSALMRLEGWTWEDMTVRDRVALHVYWPSVTVDRNPQAKKSPGDQQKDIDARLRELREAFATARTYAQAKAAGTTVDTDLRWEAMRPYVRGERPVFVHADELKQIESILNWAQTEPSVRVTLVGGLDSWRVASRLKAADIAVVLGGTHQLPLRRDDAHDAAFTVAAKLHAAGVRFCIAPGGEVANGTDRNLAYQAAKAAAHGLPPEEALKAITLYPAQLLGVGDELGSIETGKRATLIVTDGDPLEIPTQVQLAFIDGAAIELRSRQTELHEKYRERIRRTNAAKAPGGATIR
jgi:imidazolonepropionase-like amidohydrolase